MRGTPSPDHPLPKDFLLRLAGTHPIGIGERPCTIREVDVRNLRFNAVLYRIVVQMSAVRQTKVLTKP